MYELRKSELDKFISALAVKYHVFASVRTDAVRFEEVKDASAIDLSENSYVPIKQFFFPRKRPCSAFDGDKVTVDLPQTEPRVFFGVRRCDLNAVAHQDIVYLEEPKNPYYAARRANSLFIGYHCPEPSNEYCFCGSMDLKDCHDLMLMDRPDYFLVIAGSDAGRKLAQEMAAYLRPVDDKLRAGDWVTPGTDKLKTTDIAALYDNPEWQTGVDLCLSCAACTTLCPTCYCSRSAIPWSRRMSAPGAAHGSGEAASSRSSAASPATSSPASPQRALPLPYLPPDRILPRALWGDDVRRLRPLHQLLPNAHRLGERREPDGGQVDRRELLSAATGKGAGGPVGDKRELPLLFGLPPLLFRFPDYLPPAAHGHTNIDCGSVCGGRS